MGISTLIYYVVCSVSIMFLPKNYYCSVYKSLIIKEVFGTKILYLVSAKFWTVWDVWFNKSLKSTWINTHSTYVKPYHKANKIITLLFCRACKIETTLPVKLVPRMSPSNFPRTSPKDPIWSSRGRSIWRPGEVPI